MSSASAHRLPADLRQPADQRRAHFGSRDQRRLPRCRVADAPRRPAGRHRPPQVPARPATRSDRQRPGPAAVRPHRPRPAVGHRHHRTPTREGKLYCAVVLDACSRRVVGWSIETTPTAALVTNALGMAIQSRKPAAGTLIHSDQGSNLPPGRSANGPRHPGWCPPWVASAPAATMP